ncbi:Histidine Kinase [Cystobacter fuscus DSM 2262]|uniref:histidine kinase n=1 Tax=Cystobacter fuscus (strain ATCC 25194 / DSM 2262 / NBRC 100088 / M29) TaxID=1242864 RepID=S9PES5_CYSF2|nr:ATP-binding protein [Cystobacter fuscus]EPX61536.1 Histidine Kinase [Cystobacter fuscus DSM 2262]
MSNSLEFLAGGGEMGALMRAKDWSQTPLGPVETWSPALRSAVGICLGSRFPIVLYWGPTRALLYNDAWSPVPGQKHPWALGRPGAEVWAEIWDIIGPMFDHVMNTGEATWSDDQLLPLHRFGYTEECYFYYSYSPVRGEDGRVEGIFTAVTETTYRVLAERRERLLREVSERTAQARTAEESCASAIDTLARTPVEAPFCLIYLHDERSRRARLVGQANLESRADLRPAEIDLSAPPDGTTPWPLAEVLASGAAVSVGDLSSRLARRLPGTPWPEPVEEVLVTPIQGARPEVPHGFLVTGISPRRRLDAAYRTLFERVAGHITTAIANAQAYELERQRAEQLAEIDRAKTAFFSNASHEFRTPLTLMLGPLEDMLATAPPGAGPLQVEREGLERVHRNGLRLLKLVNTLLDFSRLEAGRVRAVFEPVDLAAYTAELASTFRSAMERAGLTLVVDCPPLPAPVWVDRDMWEKVVLNLLSNAFKYTFQGEVAVRLRAVDAGAELSVSDTGVGIPARELSRVFERFHRIEGQRGRSHEGTGIGLALVQELMRLLHGAVRVESEEGRGSTFTVQVPFERPQASPSPHPAPVVRPTPSKHAAAYVQEALGLLPDPPAPAVPEGALAGAALVARDTSRERLVLADDNADMRAYVRRLLTDAGYSVEATADGVEALAAVRARPPALLLSDVMMPRLDGFGLIKALRGDPSTAELPIILLSARAGEESSVEGLEAGADDYLVKPFSARELLARVEGALRLARLRRETNDTLRRANESLEARVEQRTRERDRIWNVSPDHLLITDTQGVWLSVNPSWRRTLGWREEELVGRTSEWMEHPEELTRTREEIARLASGVTTARYENRFRDVHGAWHWFSWKAVPDQGRIYCVARDVTEDKARQAELEQAQEALRQSQKLEAVGKLTGGIAHDFNNLLTGISGALELLKLRVARGEYERVDRYVSAAIASTQRASALTQRLLAFSRRQELDLKSVDMNALVGGMEDLLLRTLGERITLRVRPGTGLWRVYTDPHQLENALLNLCINARDAMPEGGTLTIATSNAHLDEQFAQREEGLAPGDYAVLSVTDTGTGIAPELRERIFEPFFTTKPSGQGTGLGLSMSYGFIKQSAGHLGLESEVGRGSTFKLYLPRHQGDAGSDEETRGDATRGAGETVLVVEDDPAVRMLVVEVLGDLGYRVLEADRAEEGLPLLQSSQRIDLLVSDIGLPGMDGRRMAELARQHRPKLKVLFITGYAAKAAVRGEFLAPGMDMLTKPFALDVLANKVREMLLGPG